MPFYKITTLMSLICHHILPA